MVTRFFDEPIPVLYRQTSEWRRVLALGVRRSAGGRYEVLVYPGAADEAAETTWVPRSRIRVVDPEMAHGFESD
jgi:hypothetical protein